MTDKTKERIKEILHELTRRHPMPNCCQDCNAKYDQALSQIVKAVEDEK